MEDPPRLRIETYRADERRRSAQHEGVRSNGWLDCERLVGDLTDGLDLARFFPVDMLWVWPRYLPFLSICFALIYAF